MAYTRQILLLFYVSVVSCEAFPQPSVEEATTKGPERRAVLDRWGNISGCPCSALNVKRPVCGTDNQTYLNIEVLRCARKCGYDVSVRYPVVCEKDIPV